MRLEFRLHVVYDNQSTQSWDRMCHLREDLHREPTAFENRRRLEFVDALAEAIVALDDQALAGDLRNLLAARLLLQEACPVQMVIAYLLRAAHSLPGIALVVDVDAIEKLATRDSEVRSELLHTLELLTRVAINHPDLVRVHRPAKQAAPVRDAP